MIELGEVFGQIPDDIAARMSEEWYWKSLVYLAERAQAKPKPTGSKGGPVPEPEPDELVDGKWYLTG